MNPNEDIVRIATIFLLGFLVPLIAAQLFHEILALYLTGSQFTYLSAAGFFLVVWPLFAILDLDRVNFVLGAMVFPWILAFALMVTIGPWAMEGIVWMVRYGDGIFAYAGAIMAAGLTAFVIHYGFEHARSERSWVPRPDRIAIGAVLLLTIGLLVTGGVATWAASGATISDVDVGVSDDYRAGMGSIGFVTTVEADPAELRLTITTPDGTTTTERITPSELATGDTTIEFVEWQVNVPLEAGTYEITLSSISGITVDQTTFTVETEARPTLEQLDVAPPNEDLDIDPPADAVERSTGAADEVRIGTVLANDGEVPGRFTTRLMTSDGEFLTLQDITVPGDGHGVNVQSLSADAVDQIRAEDDGTLTVEILHDGSVIETREVSLPDE